MPSPAPGKAEVEVRPGDELEIGYEGENRRVRVLAVMPWGLRAWDKEKAAVRAFKFDKIGAANVGTPPDHETDAAALG